jgi:hypothetical protein
MKGPTEVENEKSASVQGGKRPHARHQRLSGARRHVLYDDRHLSPARLLPGCDTALRPQLC